MRIEQVYIPYWEWEDFKNGMWRRIDNEEEMLREAIIFTGDHVLYGNAMKEVVLRWPRTMINSLTNMSINPRAFVGHCACSLKFNCPEYITRMAWKELTNDQRTNADRVAQEVVDRWRINYAKTNQGVHKNMGESLLF